MPYCCIKNLDTKKLSLCHVIFLFQLDTINDKDENGDSRLHLATNTKDLELVQKLCKAGADPNARNNRGRTGIQVNKGKEMCHWG